jgi:hypothetical protein
LGLTHLHLYPTYHLNNKLKILRCQIRLLLKVVNQKTAIDLVSPNVHQESFVLKYVSQPDRHPIPNREQLLMSPTVCGSILDNTYHIGEQDQQNTMMIAC